MNSGSDREMDEEGVNVAELHAAAWEGREDDALRILKAQPHLIGTRDSAEDLTEKTAYDADYRALHMKNEDGISAEDLIEMTAYEVVTASNGTGDTPLDLPLDYKYRETAKLRALHMKNEDEKKALRRRILDEKKALRRRDWDEKMDSEEEKDFGRCRPELTKFQPQNHIIKNHHHPPKEEEEGKKKMNSTAAASFSGDNNANAEVAAARVAELLAAAWENRVNEVLQILEMDPELLRVGDPVGDTTLHVVARAGHVDALNQMIGLLQSKNRELLTAVTKQGNGIGDTPLHLALKNGHREAALLLFDAEPKVLSIQNEDGKFPYYLSDWLGNWDRYETEDEQVLSDNNNTVERIEDKDKDKVAAYEELLTQICRRNLPIPQFECKPCLTSDLELEIMRTDGSSDYEGEILEILEANLQLIQLKNHLGNTVLHEAAYSGNIDMLTKLVGKLMTTRPITSHDDQLQLPRLTLLLQGNKEGNTALHLALLRRHTTAARYLMEVAPEAAYQVDNQGYSPLCLALMLGYDDLVKYILQVLPEASISPATRHTLLTSKKWSLPHAAIRARNLNMLEMILESRPSLIDFSDEKGWGLLSYAAHKGYLEEVQFFFNKFPETVNKFDADGSLPIHKAISGGHISIFKEFISCHPQSLYSIDKKGRSILHIAARYAKADILSYLTHETINIQTIFNLRDHDGKTFVDLANELKHN